VVNVGAELLVQPASASDAATAMAAHAESLEVDNLDTVAE
jgi:hypothetical protein